MGGCIDLTGQKFGRWTVIKRVENNKYGQAMWLCECSCENKTKRIVSGSSLRSKKSQSCGCLNREISSIITSEYNKKAKKKYNKYDLSGEYGIGYDCNGKEFYFDLEDYNKIKNYCWYIRNDGYVVTNDFNNNYKVIKMHRLLCPNAKLVDHRNRIKHDNRKENLKECTYSENNINKSIYSNNTSGVTGVSWHKQSGKWCATIKINGKQKHLGSFVDFDDAVKVRKEAEKTYYNNYRYKDER